MKKMNILKSLVDCGVVAVVRGKTKEVGVDIAKACVKGNVKGLEITFTNKYAADIIKELANIYEYAIVSPLTTKSKFIIGKLH